MGKGKMSNRDVVGLAGALLVVAILLILGLGIGRAAPVAPGGPHAAQERSTLPAAFPRPAYSQINGYALRQISLPNFAYLYPYLYNYRLQYPELAFAGQCAGGVLYISNSSDLNCWDPANNSAWATSGALTLLYQRTAGIQAQIDNEFQLDTPYDVALLYGNATTSAGPVTLETVNLTTGAILKVATPVPMSNSVQADYVGHGLVVTWNASGTNGGPEITNMSNGTSWRSGLAVGVAPNNVYWVAQIGAFIDVAGTHLAELKIEGGTSIKNVGNAWVNHTGLTSVSAVDGVQYRASSGQFVVQESTNLGSWVGVVQLTGGVLTPARAYGFLAGYSLGIQRYAYTSPYVWAITTANVTELVDPLDNLTLAAPNVLTRQNASGANGNFEFTDPYTTSEYLSLNTSLVGNATRAPTSFVWATSPAAVHAQPYKISNSLTYATGTFQDLIGVNSNTYSAWEAANLTNIFWTYAANGTSIPAWLEANASNTATNSLWWLSLASIPGSGSVSVFEDFASTTTVTFSRGENTGEAPEFTSTYGAFDNGPVVFPQYDNFRGTSLDSSLWVASGITASVSNGLTTSSAPSASSGAICGLIGVVQNVTTGRNLSVDAYATTASSARIGPAIGTVGTSSSCTTANDELGNLDYSATAYQASNLVGLFTQTSSGTITTNTVGLHWKTTVPYVMGLETLGKVQSVLNNETVIGASVATNISSSLRYPAIWMKANSGSIGPVYWVRERIAPTVMPTAATVPQAPTALTTTSPTSVKIVLNYTLPPGTVSNVSAWPWVGTTCSGVTLGTVTGLDVSTLSVLSLTANTTYSFRVAAYNSSGMGALSACVAGSTIGVPYAPGSLTTGTPRATSISLFWVNAPGYTSNETVWAGPSCGSWALALSTNGTASTFNLAHLKPTTRYSVAVSSWNATGESPLSGCATFTTATPGPPGPTPGPSPAPPTPGLETPVGPSSLGTWIFVGVLFVVAIAILSRIRGDDETRD